MREKLVWCFFFIAALYLVVIGGRVEDRTAEARGEVKRIVSLSPSNTEVLFALGAQNEVVGVTTYCDYPPEATKKEKIGNFYNCDIEKIISLRPDIVLADGSLQAETVRQLRRAGMWVVPVKNENLAQVLTSIENIAALIGRKEEGAVLTEKLDKLRSGASDQLKDIPRQKRVFIEVWDHPLLTVGNKSYLNDLVRQAGGINVAARADRDYFSWDMEEIYTADPDVYLRLRGNDMGSKADKLPGKLTSLGAVKENAVVTVFGDWIVRPGPRSFEALPEIFRAIYPEGGAR